MKQRPRIYYTQDQKALMWERWRKGDSLQQIAQLFDRNHSSVMRILAETGGIQPAQRHSGLSVFRREKLAPTQSGIPVTRIHSPQSGQSNGTSRAQLKLHRLPRVAVGPDFV